MWFVFTIKEECFTFLSAMLMMNRYYQLLLNLFLGMEITMSGTKSLLAYIIFLVEEDG